MTVLLSMQDCPVKEISDWSVLPGIQLSAKCTIHCFDQDEKAFMLLTGS